MLEVYLVELRPNLMTMMLTQPLTIDPFDVSGYLNANNLTISHDVDLIRTINLILEQILRYFS
jgi:hypothetical protein